MTFATGPLLVVRICVLSFRNSAEDHSIRHVRCVSHSSTNQIVVVGVFVAGIVRVDNVNRGGIGFVWTLFSDTFLKEPAPLLRNYTIAPCLSLIVGSRHDSNDQEFRLFD